MKKLLIPTLLMIGFLLTGCSYTTEALEEKDDIQEVSAPIQQEFTLNIEDEIESTSGEEYVFNGFINENTISFETTDYEGGGYITVSIYQPATVGHKFKFKEVEGLEFELLDVSRKEGYIKLKVDKVQ
jgi:predicted small secreted protein